MGDEKTFTITELAREFDITPRAIRFYEDEGLLTPARAGRTRVYSKADRTRLKLTLRGKRLGLSLAEIRELIEMYGGVHDSVPQLQRFLGVLATRRAALEQQRLDIQAVLLEIDMLEQQCHALLGKNVEGAEAAREELEKHINSSSDA
ncbi:MerR family DNA-binding transcriptional regulator [Thauera sp. 2A1]|uniref:MerR family transcriptional regulator n=1 Tax=Thauera sp. 2A1 TaxID=2570191 RepID=UPI0012926603|nr:MerR family DNA-binding transcriptional regulator [Thauera sp. 2A1]KAI5915505.1 MerR family DNA-binding transcriptional regulator [Thauera sp. 2A1]